MQYYLSLHFALTVGATLLYLNPKTLNVARTKLLATTLVAIQYVFEVASCLFEGLGNTGAADAHVFKIVYGVVASLFLCPISNILILFVLLTNFMAWRRGDFRFLGNVAFVLVLVTNLVCIVVFNYILSPIEDSGL